MGILLCCPPVIRSAIWVVWGGNLDVILVTFGSLCAWGPTLSMMRVCVREERGGDEEEGLWDVGCTLYHPCSINCNFCWWPTRFWTDKIIASCKTFNKSFKLKGKCVITDAIGGGGFYIYYIVHLVNLYNNIASGSWHGFVIAFIKRSYHNLNSFSPLSSPETYPDILGSQPIVVSGLHSWDRLFIL